MLERFLWIVADESYYDDEITKAHLPSNEWFRVNQYVIQRHFPNLLQFCVNIFFRKVLVDACSFYSLMSSQLKKNSKLKTKERNTREVLEEQNKWIGIDELISVTNEEYDNVMKIEKMSGMHLFFCSLFTNKLI